MGKTKTITSHSEILSIVASSDFQSKLNRNMNKIRNILNRELQIRKFVEVYGWDPEVVQDMYKNYIQFLGLIKTLSEFNLNIKVIPNRYIDEFWHNHILDTYQYMLDCEEIFGYYLHHYPYYGMRNEEDKKDWFENAQLVQKIWETCFGEKIYGSLEENEDSYQLDKAFNKQLSKLYKEGKLATCRRCRTCRPTNCP